MLWQLANQHHDRQNNNYRAEATAAVMRRGEDYRRCTVRNDLLNGRTDGVGHPERLVVLDGGITRSLMFDLRV